MENKELRFIVSCSEATWTKELIKALLTLFLCVRSTLVRQNCIENIPRTNRAVTIAKIALFLLIKAKLETCGIRSCVLFFQVQSKGVDDSKMGRQIEISWTNSKLINNFDDAAIRTCDYWILVWEIENERRKTAQTFSFLFRLRQFFIFCAPRLENRFGKIRVQFFLEAVWAYQNHEHVTGVHYRVH